MKTVEARDSFALHTRESKIMTCSDAKYGAGASSESGCDSNVDARAESRTCVFDLSNFSFSNH
jgi:hypothetical protein